MEWDEPLDTTIRDEWHMISRAFLSYALIEHTFHQASIALHIFADTSMKPYRAVAFLLSNYITFAMAKNCVKSDSTQA